VGAFRESKRSDYPVSVESIIPAHNGRFWAIPVGRQNSIRICGAHTLDRPYAWSRAQTIGPRAVVSDPLRDRQQVARTVEGCHEGRRQRRGAGLVGLKTRNVADVMTRLKTGTPAEMAGVL